MKRLKKYLIAGTISLIVLIIVLYLMQDEYSGKGNTSLAAIFAVGVFWRVIKFFDFKEKGLSNGLAFFRTLAFMEVPERFVQSEQEKKKKETDAFAKQLFSGKRK